MTVESTTSRAQYSTNGTTGPWTIPFYFLANTDVLIVHTASDGTQTTLVHGATCTVTGAGVQAGGSVTTVTAYAAGGTITITRSPALLQSSNYSNNDRFPATTVESDLDRGVMVDQYLNELVSRSLKFPVQYNGADGEFPGDPADYEGYYFGVGAGGAPTYLLAPSGSAGALAGDLASTTDPAKGAHMIGFKQSGGVAETVFDALERAVYHDQFAGADDAEKLTAALAVADCVLIRPGTWTASTSVSIGANKRVHALIPGKTTWTVTADVKAFILSAAYSQLDGLYVTKSGAHTTNLVEVGTVSVKADRAILSNLRVVGAGNDNIQVINGNAGVMRDVQCISATRDNINFTTDTADNNLWKFEGTVECSSAGRDNFHLEGTTAVGNANNPRSHKGRLFLQSAVRHNFYCNTRSSLFEIYSEAAGDKDLYFDTYAYGNEVSLVEASGFAGISQVVANSNTVKTHSLNADYLRGYWSKQFFSGRAGLGYRISNDDGTAGYMDVEKTAVREFKYKLQGSGSTFNVYWDNTTTAGALIGRWGGTWMPDADNSRTLGQAATGRWANVYTTQLTVSPPASTSPANNGEVVFQLTSNTSLTFKAKGSDGVVRAGSITLS